MTILNTIATRPMCFEPQGKILKIKEAVKCKNQPEAGICVFVANGKYTFSSLSQQVFFMHIVYSDTIQSIPKEFQKP